MGLNLIQFQVEKFLIHSFSALEKLRFPIKWYEVVVIN